MDNKYITLSHLDQTVWSLVQKINQIKDSIIIEETDPVFLASAASQITRGDIQKWNGLLNSPAAYITQASFDDWNEATRIILNNNYMVKGTDYVTAGQKSSATLGSKATAEGEYTTASGSCSHAEGYATTASSATSHAEGTYTRARGAHAHAEGGLDWDGSMTSVNLTSIENETKRYTASAIQAHYIGKSIELGSGNFTYITNIDMDNKIITVAETLGTLNDSSVGICERETVAQGDSSHAEGVGTSASGNYAHAEGYYTASLYEAAHAEGYRTVALERGSHAEGFSTTASGYCSHAEGFYTTAAKNYSHAEGQQAIASGACAHAEGTSTIASGQNSHAEGLKTTAEGGSCHAEGTSTIASGDYSHAEGCAIASGDYSHAEGAAYRQTYTLTGDENSTTYTVNTTGTSFIEIGLIVQNQDNSLWATITDLARNTFGYVSTITLSKSLGKLNRTAVHICKGIASGLYSHIEGQGTIASNKNSHAEGYGAVASGTNSHAEGYDAEASGANSHAEGFYTLAASQNQHVFGKYNVKDLNDTYVEIVGIGTGFSDANRKNGRTLDWSGNEVLAGKLTVGAGPTENMDVATKLYVDSIITVEPMSNVQTMLTELGLDANASLTPATVPAQTNHAVVQEG